MSGEYVPEVAALERAVAPFWKGLKVRNPRWISTPDGDLGTEWCADCGYYKVRNLRRRDRKRAGEYIMDGGWRTEEEHFCFCTSCGVRLDVCLTEYGLISEIQNYEDCGFSTDPAVDAYEISEMLGHVEYRYESEAPEGEERRMAVIAIARGFLAQTQAKDRPDA